MPRRERLIRMWIGLCLAFGAGAMVCADDEVDVAPTGAAAPGLAILTPAGVEILRDGVVSAIPQTAGYDALAWDSGRERLVLAGQGGLHQVSLDGSVFGILTIGWPLINAPDVSPAGDRLVFVGSRDGVGSKMHVMDAKGGDPRSLTEGYEPAWTADGTGILFERDDELGARLARYDLATGRVTPVHEDRAATTGATLAPATDDTGARIAYVADGHITVETRADGQVRTYDVGGHPTFSPDGTLLAYIRAAAEGASAVVVVDLATGDETVVRTVDAIDLVFVD
ncbi:MAG: PD40 domain-containing protein [Phycisphaerales bacterium]|nr:PD40 domain-containing protein [Phycisphaerales bacterium]